VAASFIAQRFAVPATAPARLGTGLLALGLLVAGELLLAVVLQDRSPGTVPREPRSPVRCIWECWCSSRPCRTSSRAYPLAFELTVNVDSWEEQRVPHREARISRWANKFLEELSKEDKRLLSLFYNDRFAKKRLQERTLNRADVLNGALVCYVGIISEDKSFKVDQYKKL
jgi:hypothetical protein